MCGASLPGTSSRQPWSYCKAGSTLPIHTHNLFTPGGRAERATNTNLILLCLCYIAASLAPVSSLARFSMPFIVQVQALAPYLGRLFSIHCLSSSARRLVLLAADWLRVSISKRFSKCSASYLRRLKRSLLHVVQVC
jgi:hypothetical protein